MSASALYSGETRVSTTIKQPIDYRVDSIVMIIACRFPEYNSLMEQLNLLQHQLSDLQNIEVYQSTGMRDKTNSINKKLQYRYFNYYSGDLSENQKGSSIVKHINMLTSLSSSRSRFLMTHEYLKRLS